jgi:hypothetical protein
MFYCRQIEFAGGQARSIGWCPKRSCTSCPRRCPVCATRCRCVRGQVSGAVPTLNLTINQYKPRRRVVSGEQPLERRQLERVLLHVESGFEHERCAVPRRSEHSIRLQRFRDYRPEFQRTDASDTNARTGNPVASGPSLLGLGAVSEGSIVRAKARAVTGPPSKAMGTLSSANDAAAIGQVVNLAVRRVPPAPPNRARRTTPRERCESAR